MRLLGRYVYGSRLGDAIRSRPLLRQDAFLRTTGWNAGSDVRSELCPVVHLKLRVSGCGHRLRRVSGVGVAYVSPVLGAVGLRIRRRAVEQVADKWLETGDAGCYDGHTDFDGCPRA